MSEKRITVEEAKAAYEATKAKPVIQVYCTKDNTGQLCCCAVGAIFLSQGQPSDRDAGYWAESVYGHAYLANFCAGFDGDAFPDNYDSINGEDLEAFEDGQAVAKAVFQTIK